MESKLTEKERLELIKRVTKDHEKVARVCREKGISRVLFYRWLKRYHQSKKPVGSLLSPQDRLRMIERVQSGETVTDVCRDYGVSRVIFYRFKRRYEEAPEGQKLEALWDRKPQIDRFYRQAPPEVEKAVLSVVIQYPELSSHKIVEFLPQVGGQPVLGNHGVQNVLKRHNLTTYADRLAYSKTRRHVPGLIDKSLHLFQMILGALLALPARRRLLTLRLSAGFLVGVFVGIVWFGLQGYMGMMGEAPLENKFGLFFASVALAAGSFFFLYSFKYYATLALVLGFSRHVGEDSGVGYQGGLQPSLDQITLKRTPFVSIHLPVYNEKKVVDRLLTACTSMSYENYEVIVIDDSTDETTQILKDWQNHPRVKVIHRDSREGFKGGALQVALEKTDPRTEFVLIFDADFVPYPDTITQFLKYFQSVMGSLEPDESKIAAVQGYQWHVLNKSENWITRGVRSEYAGNYVVERSGAEVLGALKQIAGSVYMVRKDILDKFGWQTSITEDFQLTLRLYEAGYKVVYTPYVQAPSECVSTIKRLVRQRMRWAEGHSHNVRKNFIQILRSPNMTFMEKLEFIYLSPYYLQSALFLIGTLAWFISEALFHDRLPFWTALWGWSLVLTNMFALPLMNTVGLFLEESEERDYLGVLSFVVLSYLLVPFQAYAAVKGFLEKEEGPWFRTPKTGKITDIFTRGRFYRWLSGILPGKVPAGNVAPNPYLALATANNQFRNFTVKRRRLKWLSKAVLATLLIFSITIYSLSLQLTETYAAMSTATQYLSVSASGTITSTVSWQLAESLPGTDCNMSTTSPRCPGIKRKAVSNVQFQPDVYQNVTDGTPGGGDGNTPSGLGWLFDGDAAGVQIGTDTWQFKTCIDATDSDGDSAGNLRVMVWTVGTSGGAISSYTKKIDQTTSGTDYWADGYYTFTTSSVTGWTFSSEQPQLYVEYWSNKTAQGDATDATNIRITGAEFATCGAGNDTMLVTPTITVPEFLLIFIPLIPFIPFLAKKLRLKLFMSKLTFG